MRDEAPREASKQRHLRQHRGRPFDEVDAPASGCPPSARVTAGSWNTDSRKYKSSRNCRDATACATCGLGGGDDADVNSNGGIPRAARFSLFRLRAILAWSASAISRSRQGRSCRAAISNLPSFRRRAGECAALVTEELGLEQVSGIAAQLIATSRTVRPRARVAKCARAEVPLPVPLYLRGAVRVGAGGAIDAVDITWRRAGESP